MEGRIQREIGIEKLIESRIADEIGFVQNFYHSMHGKSATTKEKYVSYVIRFIRFCEAEFEVQKLTEEQLRMITPDIMDKYVGILSAKMKDGEIVGKNDESTVANKLSAISTFFKFLCKRNIIEVNPCEHLDRPKIPEKEGLVYLTQEEIAEVLSNVENGVGSQRAKERQKHWKTRDKLLIVLPLVLGIRVSALTDINIEDIDIEQSTLMVTEKENKRRVFHIPDGLNSVMEEWLEVREELVDEFGGDTSALFITVFSDECKRITTKTVSNIVKKYSESVGKKITPHKLRATMATNTYEATGDIYLVSELLGHKSPKTTRRYARASEKKKEEAVGIMSGIVGL